MAYLLPNFKSKAAAKRAIVEGQLVRVIPNSAWGDIPQDGVVSIEGPHYPKPHTFYGEATVKGGKVVKIT